MSIVSHSNASKTVPPLPPTPTRAEALDLAKSTLRPGANPSAPIRAADGTLMPGMPIEMWAPNHLYARGQKLLLKGAAQEAYRYIQACMVLQPSDEGIFMRSAALAQLDRPERALADIDVYLEHIQSDPSAYALRGAELLALDRFDEAINAYDRALKLKRDYHSARYERATCLLATGQFGAALRDLEKVERFVEEDDEVDYWLARAQVCDGLGLVEVAEKCRRQAGEQ